MNALPHVDEWNDGRIYAAEVSASVVFSVSCWTLLEDAAVLAGSPPMTATVVRVCVAGVQGGVMGCTLIAYALLLWKAFFGRVPAPFRVQRRAG